MKPIGAARPSVTPPGAGADKLARMKHVANQFEGVFVEQMFKAMRETVPQDGDMSGGAGEEMFTSLMDEHVASEAPGQWHHGVGNAIIARFAPKTDAQGSTVALPITLPHSAREAP